MKFKKKLLHSNNLIFSKLAETLLIKETLNYDEVVELIGPPLHESAKKKIEPVDFEDALNSLSQEKEK